MIHYFRRYLHHVRRQSHAIKEVHALLFATVGTLLVVTVYIMVASVSSDKDSEGKQVVSTEFASPFSLFTEQMKQAVSTVLKSGTLEVSNTENSEKSP